MLYLVSTVFLLLCLFSVRAMLRKPNGAGLTIGITALFSIGYYVLPLVFREEARLDVIADDLLIELLTMALVFFAALLSGYFASERFFRTKAASAGIDLRNADRLFVRHYRVLFVLSVVGWLVYYANNEITSYQSLNADDFFNEQAPYRGLWSLFGVACTSTMAMAVVIALARKRYVELTIFSCVLLAILSALVATAQRLAVIAPVFSLVAALGAFGFQKQALRAVVIGVVFLFVVSPIVVFMRQLPGASGGDVIGAISHYQDTGGSVTADAVASVMERADLLYNMAFLKNYIDDASAGVGAQYYLSVLHSFLPGFVVGEKLYPLSDNGLITGELSVIAWQLASGQARAGSLTAFGAIVAYREGGWIWIVCNGFLTGVLFSAVYNLLARRGVMGPWLYSSLFVSLCVKNAPPSFFQAIVYLSSNVWLAGLLILLELVLRSFRKERPIAVARPQAPHRAGEGPASAIPESPVDSPLGVKRTN